MDERKQLSAGCRAIIRRLYNQRRIGGKHLPENLALRPLKNMPKEDYRQTIKDWEKCIKEGLVLTKPTHSGRHVYLNPKRISEIYELITGQ